MMTWNYRLIRHTEGDQSWLSIHEVYYDEGGQIMFWCEAPSSPFGENRDEIEDDLFDLQEALEYPIIEDDGGNGGRIDAMVAQWENEPTVPLADIDWGDSIDRD